MAETTTYSHIANPCDTRCSWLQLIPSEAQVLSAELVGIDGAGTLPGSRQRRGADSELPAWTIIFDIEANHPRKQRGWRHLVGIVADVTMTPVWIEPTAAMKAAIKAEAPQLMAGSGPNAALVRVAKFILLGQTEEERMRRLQIVTG